MGGGGGKSTYCDFFKSRISVWAGKFDFENFLILPPLKMIIPRAFKCNFNA